MSIFSALAKEALTQGVAMYATSRASTAKNTIVYGAIVGALSFTSTVFLAVSAFFYFAQAELYAFAGLYTSVLLFILALAFYLFMKIKERMIERQMLRERIEMQNAMEVTLLELGSELEGPIRDNPIASLLVSGITGFALAKKYL